MQRWTPPPVHLLLCIVHREAHCCQGTAPPRGAAARMPTALPDNDKELSNAPGQVGEDGDLKIHEKSIDTVAKELQTDLVKGISSAEAAVRFEKYGPNELEQPPRISLLMLFIIQLNSVIMYLLMAAVVASAAIRATGEDRNKFLSYVDSIAITIIVLINATIAAVTENNANDALAALSSLQTPESIVIRDGQEVQIKSREMVPGE